MSFDFDHQRPVRCILGYLLLAMILPAILLLQVVLKPKPWSKLDIAISRAITWVYEDLIHSGPGPNLGYVDAATEFELARRSIEAHALNEQKMRGYNGQSNRPKRAHD